MKKLLLIGALFAAGHPARAIDGVWVSTNPDPAATAFSGTLAISPAGDLFLGYVSTGSNFARVAEWTGTGWLRETFSPNVGGPPEVAVDGSGRPHAFYSINATGLRYGVRTGGVWSTEVVSSTPSAVIRLALDDSGNPLAAAGGNSSQALYYARASTGGWTMLDISTHTTFEFCDVAAAGGIVYAGCNAGVNGPGFSVAFTLYRKNGNVFERIFSSDSRGGVPAIAVDGAGHVRVLSGVSLTELDYFELVPGTPTVVADQRRFTSGAQLFSYDLAVAASGAVVAFGAVNGGYLAGEDVNFSTEIWSTGGSGGVRLALDPNGRPYTNANASGYQLFGKLSPASGLAVGSRTPSSITYAFSHPPASSSTGFWVRRASDGAALSPLLPPGTLEWTQSGLAPNAPQTVYADSLAPGFVLRSTDTTVYSAAAAPRDLTLTRSPGGGLSAVWAANGNPAGTSYVLDLLSVDGSSQTLTVANTNGAFAFTRDAPTAFVLRGRTPDGYDTFFSTLIASHLSGAAWQASFGLSTGSRLDAVMAGVGEDTILGAGPVDGFPLGGFLGAPLDPTGQGFEVETGEGVPSGAALTLTYRYPAGAFSGYPPSALLLARYDASRGLWAPLPSQHNAGLGRIQAAANGVGIFQVMARLTTPTGLVDAVVYPNPFRPSQGLTLRDLPPGAHIKVYTLGGRLIREMRGSDQGIMLWDGKDGRGEHVASGTYLLRAESGGQKREFKVVAER